MKGEAGDWLIREGDHLIAAFEARETGKEIWVKRK